MVQFDSFVYCCSVFLKWFTEEDIFPIAYSWLKIKCINWPYIHWYISRLPILFHSSLRLFLCQHHAALITIACSIVWNQRAYLYFIKNFSWSFIFFFFFSFGTYFSVSSFGWIFCVRFYELGKTTTAPSVEVIALCRIFINIDRMCWLPLAG